MNLKFPYWRRKLRGKLFVTVWFWPLCSSKELIRELAPLVFVFRSCTSLFLTALSAALVLTAQSCSCAQALSESTTFADSASVASWHLGKTLFVWRVFCYSIDSQSGVEVFSCRVQPLTKLGLCSLT